MLLTKKIDSLAKSERITKKVLGELSRELLIDYLNNDNNVQLINKLLGCNAKGEFVLTPFNWRLVCKYFRDFLPHKSNWDVVGPLVAKGGKRTPLVFEKKSSNRAKKIGVKLDQWLADESNNIWNYKCEVVTHSVNYELAVVNDVKKALDPEKGGLSVDQVLVAVFEGGVQVEDMLAIIARIQRPIAA